MVCYAMPQVLSRPVIVNLWGMTRVGKTDLIRRLVKALDIQDRSSGPSGCRATWPSCQTCRSNGPWSR